MRKRKIKRMKIQNNIFIYNYDADTYIFSKSTEEYSI